jgi:hypothetical protein
MSFEVMQQLALGDENNINELLDLWVAYLHVQEDLADEVHRPLDLVGVPILLPLYDEHRADHLGGGGDVKEE